jgi:hypothetical protein
MPEAASLAVAPPSAGIDHTRCFIAPEFTPLFHTPAYRLLPSAAQLRYNQLHALYFNEQVAFFEQEMLSPALVALLRCPLPADLIAGLQSFFEEEQRHSAMFRNLNRRCAPEFYGESASYFIRVAQPWRALLGAMTHRPLLFPLVVWLSLLQEERSLFYSKGCLARAHDLEPHFVATHRSHIADEVGHIAWDEELLDWLWPRTSSALRQMNAKLLRWMVREFFLLPKRSGLRVVSQLVQEFPQLDFRALDRGMRGLKNDAAYLRTLYSRDNVPRSFARFDAHLEFAPLARMLLGGHSTGSDS